MTITRNNVNYIYLGNKVLMPQLYLMTHRWVIIIYNPKIPTINLRNQGKIQNLPFKNNWVQMSMMMLIKLKSIIKNIYHNL